VGDPWFSFVNLFSEGCHPACAYGCDPIAANRRHEPRDSVKVCIAPFYRGKFHKQFRCVAPYVPIRGKDYGCQCPKGVDCSES
jgi:hypothetical protein